MYIENSLLKELKEEDLLYVDGGVNWFKVACGVTMLVGTAMIVAGTGPASVTFAGQLSGVVSGGLITILDGFSE